MKYLLVTATAAIAVITVGGRDFSNPPSGRDTNNKVQLSPEDLVGQGEGKNFSYGSSNNLAENKDAEYNSQQMKEEKEEKHLRELNSSFGDKIDSLKDYLNNICSDMSSLVESLCKQKERNEQLQRSLESNFVDNIENLEDKLNNICTDIASLKESLCKEKVTTSPIPTTTSALTTTPPAECSESDGFFEVPESENQCFKFYPDSGMTWEAAQTKCQEDGLVLAKLDDPETAVAVRKFIVETYGGNDRLAWVGARGTGSTLNWIRDDTSLPSSSSLWWPGQPGNYLSDSYCLELMGRESNMNSYPTKVYHMAGCTGTNKSPLCELIN